MLGRKPKAVNTKIDEAMIRLLDEMEKEEPSSQEYQVMLGQLEKVSALQDSKSPRKTVSPDVIVSTVGTILAIGLIAAYEQKHVWTSKGLGFVPKPKA